jgi:hypothetical protein
MMSSTVKKLASVVKAPLTILSNSPLSFETIHRAWKESFIVVRQSCTDEGSKDSRDSFNQRGDSFSQQAMYIFKQFL